MIDGAVSLHGGSLILIFILFLHCYFFKDVIFWILIPYVVNIAIEQKVKQQKE